MSFFFGGPLSGPFYRSEVTGDCVDLRVHPDPELPALPVEGSRSHQVGNQTGNGRGNVLHNEHRKEGKS